MTRQPRGRNRTMRRKAPIHNKLKKTKTATAAVRDDNFASPTSSAKKGSAKSERGNAAASAVRVTEAVCGGCLVQKRNPAAAYPNRIGISAVDAGTPWVMKAKAVRTLNPQTTVNPTADGQKRSRRAAK